MTPSDSFVAVSFSHRSVRGWVARALWWLKHTTTGAINATRPGQGTNVNRWTRAATIAVDE